MSVIASASPAPWQPRARQVERFAGPYAFGEHAFEVRGVSTPIVQVRLAGAVPVHFDVHTLLWRDPAVRIDRGPARGQRTAADEDMALAAATGQGCLALSPRRPGCVFMLYLPAGKEIEVRLGHCLCAAGTRYEGSSNDTTTVLERFKATETDGLLVLCGRGNAFELMLEPDETLHLHPQALLYKDRTVAIAGPAGTGGLPRYTGPGLIAVQTVGWSG